MTQDLQRHGYQVTALEPMNDGYLKNQQYLFLFDAVFAVKVIEHLPMLGKNSSILKKSSNPEVL